MKRTIALLLVLASLHSTADYSDVLLVSNSNSPLSLQIAQYFSLQRNISHELAVGMPASEKIKYEELQRTLILPLKRYLNESGAKINYIVLAKGIPLYTDESDVFAVGNDMGKANASSVDSELALLGSRYEGEMGAKGYAINPYYGKSEPFSHEKFEGYLVTRLDGYDYADVKGMIDRAAAVSPQELAKGQHVLLDFRGIYGYQLSRARQALNGSGLQVYAIPGQLADESQSGILAQSRISAQRVSYYDTFGCYNLGGCNASYSGVPKYSWANGALVSIKYSFSARTSSPPLQSQDFSGWPRSFIADYIHEGATGGVGYAVEPMSSQVANPEYLAQSYLSGRNLAETLWSAVPSLSWSAVVYGDPKAQYPKLKNETSPSAPSSSQPKINQTSTQPSSPKTNRSRAIPPAPSANKSYIDKNANSSADPAQQAQKQPGELTPGKALASTNPKGSDSALSFLQGALLALAVAASLYLLSKRHK